MEWFTFTDQTKYLGIDSRDIDIDNFKEIQNLYISISKFKLIITSGSISLSLRIITKSN